MADDDRAWANEYHSVNIDSVTFSSTSTSALSSVVSPGGRLHIVHDFHQTPATKNLYELTVTLENLSNSTTINDLRYRRVVDFDVWPTASTVKKK